MNETDLENELRGLRPAPPTAGLVHRIEKALEPSQVTPAANARPRFAFTWWLERLIWAGAGAAAVWVTTSHANLFPIRTSPNSTIAAASTAPAIEIPQQRISEESLAWKDEGVQFVDGGTPARLLRRVTLEKHRSADGSVEVQVPREDVILLPVALR